MTKRIVEVSSSPARISLANGQVRIKALDDNGAEKLLQLPAEDLGLLILDNQRCNITVPALAGISANGGVVVVSDDAHLPASILLPISAHSETVHRIRDQANAAKPLVKRLWKQVVTAKLRAQAKTLPVDSAAHRKLIKLAGGVLSGDSSNREAQGARLYWSHWARQFPGFSRDFESGGINALLNYGYSVLRACTARALVGSGFCTAIGLHHHNRSNPFCLADDMMEPLRPLVDRRVWQLALRGETLISPDVKRELLGLLLEPVKMNNQRIPLMDSLSRSSAQLALCLRGDEDRLIFAEEDRA